MKGFVPERFSVIRILRQDRYTKTFLANDYLLEQENVVVRILKKDRVKLDEDRLINHFSWQIGVHHIHFAKVFDSGLTRQQHLYVVREYLPSSELLTADVLRATRSLVSAVDFLSSHGRVHGGIKPSNIFVGQESLKLADANIPGIGLDDQAESVHFVAPEIWRSSDPTHEADLYSLGAVLYYLLTGRHLFEDIDPNRLRAKYATASPQAAPS